MGGQGAGLGPYTTPGIPDIYKDYMDTFERNVDSLPLHRDYDCPIDLQPWLKVAFPCIYALLEPEIVALPAYSHENRS